MVDWNEVASILDRIAGTSDDTLLDHGQKASVTELACRIRAGQRSALLADEVGMGSHEPTGNSLSRNGRFI